ncbi:MAG: Asp/Glu racemase, partial [Comamonadaceae bacterium]
MTGRPDTLAVINPNSSRNVTQTIAEAMRAAQGPHADRFVFVTLEDGPPGIVTEDDAAIAAEQVQAWVRRNGAHHVAVAVACFSDPGVAAAREGTSTPVIGLGESGMRRALEFGRQVGVIAVARAAIPRHMRYWSRLGVA